MFTSDVIGALLRVLGWSVFLFWFAAFRLFRDPAEGPSNPLVPVAQALFVAVASIIGLSLLGILDTLSLAASFVTVGLARGWRRRRRGQRRASPLRELGYDLMDGHLSVRGLLQRRWAAGRHAWARSRRRLGARLPEAVALTAIVLGALALRLPAVAEYPFPETLAEVAEIRRLKEVGAGQAFAGKVAPLGVHALVAALRSLTLLDEVLIWKTLGLAVTVWTAVLCFVAVRLLGAGRRAGPGLLAAAVATLLPGSAWSVAATPTGEVRSLSLTALLLALALVVHARGARRSARLVAAMVLVAWAHPVAGLILGAALLMTWLGAHALRYPALHVGTSARGLGLGLATAAAMVGLQAWRADGLSWAWLQEIWVTEGDAGLMDTPLYAAGAAAAVLGSALANPRTRAGRMAVRYASGALAVGLLIFLPRLWPGVGLSSGALHDLLPPTIAIAIGVAADRVLAASSATRGFARRWRVIPTVGVVAGLLILRPPQVAVAGTVRESPGVLRAFIDVRDRFVPHTWTIVGHPELAIHVLGYGWHMRQDDFLERFEPESYVWDPRRPKASLPSPHVFLVVQKDTLPSDDEDARRARLDLNAALDRWCRAYRRTHDDMHVLVDDDTVRVYHLERRREVERELLDRIWREENGYDTDAALEAVDDAVAPPVGRREWERCTLEP